MLCFLRVGAAASKSHGQVRWLLDKCDWTYMLCFGAMAEAVRLYSTSSPPSRRGRKTHWWRKRDSNRRSPVPVRRGAFPNRPSSILRGGASFDVSGTSPSERDQRFESLFLQRRVCLASAFRAYRRKDPAFARSVSLDVTRERDVLATSRLALAAFL